MEKEQRHAESRTRRGGQRQKEREGGRERERKKWKNALGENRYPPPPTFSSSSSSSLTLFPSRNPPRAHIDAIFQYRVKRSLASPSPLLLASSRFFLPSASFLSRLSRERVEQRISRHAARRERERERHETRKRRERGGNGGNPGICDLRLGERRRERERERKRWKGRREEEDMGSTR